MTGLQARKTRKCLLPNAISTERQMDKSHNVAKHITTITSQLAFAVTLPDYSVFAERGEAPSVCRLRVSSDGPLLRPKHEKAQQLAPK